MPNYTSRQLAEVLNNSDDAAEIVARDEFIIRTKDTAKRHPAEYAFSLKAHYTEEQLANFAMPGSNEKSNTDWRGQPITGNQKPIWDKYITKDMVAGTDVKHRWYREFVEVLTAGKRHADILWLLRITASKDVDLSGINTIINVETTKITATGEPEMIRLDARMLTPGERQEFIRTYDKHLNDLSDSYAKAFKVLIMIDLINTRAELQNKVRVGWNWADVQDHSKGLHPNGAPILVEALGPNGTVITWTSWTWERLLQVDVDKAVLAGATYNTLIDNANKWKKPDEDRIGAGQGETQEKARRTSKIKVKDMPDVIYEVVAFFCNDDTVVGMKNARLHATEDVRMDIDGAIVKLHTALDKYITQDMMDNAKRLERIEAEYEAAETEARLANLQETTKSEAQPTQNQRNAADEWRKTEAARQNAELAGATPAAKPQSGKTPSLNVRGGAKRRTG